MKNLEIMYCDLTNVFWATLLDAKQAELEKKYGKLCIGTKLLFDEDLGLSEEEFFGNFLKRPRGENDHNIVEIFGVVEDEYLEDFKADYII